MSDGSTTSVIQTLGGGDDGGIFGVGDDGGVLGVGDDGGVLGVGDDGGVLGVGDDGGVLGIGDDGGVLGLASGLGLGLGSTTSFHSPGSQLAVFAGVSKAHSDIFMVEVPLVTWVARTARPSV